MGGTSLAPLSSIALRGKKTEEIASRLSNIGFGALPYHAGLEADTRRQTQERFLGGQVSIIVATIAFGMGIDNPCVRLVVHYDLPRSIEGYYQETGRAGRDGQPSDRVLFFSYADRSQQDFFIRKIEDDVERANAEKRLELMVDYCQAKSCRRQFLLNYFGEDWPHNNCGGCDICLPASDHLDLRVEFDGTEITQKLLSTIIKTESGFGANHIVNVLRGSQSKRLLSFGHDRLSVYGIARGVTADQLKDTIEQLIDVGLIERSSGRLPILALTVKARKFLENRGSITLLKRGNDIHYSQTNPVVGHDADLFEKLRRLRKNLADELGVPVFIVYHDTVLRQTAFTMPTNRTDLLAIRGVGKDKLQRFGDQFIAVISAHVACAGNASGQVLPPEI